MRPSTLSKKLDLLVAMIPHPLRERQNGTALEFGKWFLACLAQLRRAPLPAMAQRIGKR
jgi:hypothetical protein